ncbi:cysteine proteinase inhibitor [Klebsormidium nitens]|uniref:Cysteine proteinase inhibitor n=1 Tax=Klebsormidium nitens TaxID=105231 RepID=A0A1Y1IHJ0_KLENI|nr:cysteine proteinase inhibitor [Klebsormidium nitens]|eukprot:GAQ88531.1 cysteine proteinase inhibitor [Klebsormidium nitens]
MAQRVPMPGGQVDVGGSNDPDAEEVGKYVVSTIAKEQNAPDLKFVRVVSATKQVVAGLMWRLTVEVKTPVGPAEYKATVYEPPGPDATRSLEKYELVPKSSHGDSDATPSDLGAHLGGASSADAGLRTVDPEDPAVEDAAQFAIKQLQARSNSLVKPELKKVKEAKAQVGSKSTTFHLTLELQHGNRTETVPVVVDRTKDGKFSLTHAGQPEEVRH